MEQLSLSLPESLHRQLAALAQQEGVSLQQFLVHLLAQRAAFYSVRRAPEEEVTRQKDEYSRLLEELGPASHEQIRAALEAREAGEPESGLTPDLVQWLEENARAS